MSAPAASSKFAAATEAAGRGDVNGALTALDRVAKADQDGQYMVYRSSLLLSVGQVDEARAGIEKALAQNPDDGQALALRSVINVAQNDKAQALSDATRAVEMSPDASSARIALSYAQQANFQIPQARDTMLEAVKRQPDDALAWSRLAELSLMLGDRDQAMKSARKATALAPDLAQTQITQGFAALAEFKNDAASAAFERAISQNSADPMPRLGLGLAKISDGKLEAGRRDLEVAVALDGNNALLRAYLGKAYFEEKRPALDDEQFTIAKELDPLDPTAFLYDGIRLQMDNQPVAALKEVNASIERNDNRAVYRSRLLLDSDEAARNVSAARVYNDLGFQKLALVEGYKSVNTDPSNSSAHRFLADSYSVLPRHEIARVSELLQSQLLDPLNLAPIQPRAAESSLGLISAGGPATASANEFNSLFKRNQANVILSGMYGELETGSGEAVVGGIYNNLSFSVGGSRFKTDGFRVNNDQTDNISNAFIQAALSPDTSLQFEYRRRETENGDLNLHMDESFSTDLRSEQESDSYRVGLRQAFSPNSILLASIMHKADDSAFSDEPVPGLIQINEQRPDNKAFGTELQYLYRSAKYSITAGGGYFDLDESVITTQIDPFLCVPSCITPSDLSAKHSNGYVYSNIQALPDVMLTLGASFDSFDTNDAASESQDQTNPKLGITWQVQPGTTLRAAGFRVLKRSLITDQTLEPTQVAGFNQFYDDVASTDAWRGGVALDHKFSHTVFGGVEASRRDLTVPINVSDPFIGTTEKTEQDWEENLGRAYLFMMPTERIALSMEYLFERIDQPFSVPPGPTSIFDTKAHKFPLGIQYFTPSGWTIAVKGTYVMEDLDSGVEGSVTEQSSEFGLVDATVSYRLSRRRGFVTIGATNLLDKQFAYEQIDTVNTEFQPARMVFGRVTLLFN
jgi:tetratricopeptide (TPR) repeat protein